MKESSNKEKSILIVKNSDLNESQTGLTHTEIKSTSNGNGNDRGRYKGF